MASAAALAPSLYTGRIRPASAASVSAPKAKWVSAGGRRAQREHVSGLRRNAALIVRCNSTLDTNLRVVQSEDEQFRRRKGVIDARSAEIRRLLELKSRLAAAGGLVEKVGILDENPVVRDLFQSGSAFSKFLSDTRASFTAEDVYLLKLTAALGQGHIFTQLADASLHADPPGRIDAFMELLDVLRAAEAFYNVVGGLLGYQLTTVELIQAGEAAAFKRDASALAYARAPLGSDPGPPPLGTLLEVQSAALSHAAEAAAEQTFCIPPGINLIGDDARALRLAWEGLEASPALAEIYPLGGAGDRLGLHCAETGSPLPAAVLPYTGRSILSCLIRDVQAREYLYFKVFGKQLLTPIAIMTSAAKGNHRRVTELCAREGWFGRGKGAFRLFQQALVPVVCAERGQWAMDGPGAPMLKPGGHGVMWKLAQDVGVLSWLEQQGCVAGLVRQISNPMAGTDTTLLALAGAGFSGRRKFGFASCDRAVGASEGMNVLARRRTPRGGFEYNISCIEYTEFDRLGIEDVPLDAGANTSAFPANTNVIYAQLGAIRAALQKGPAGCFPGMLVNLSKPCQSFGEPEPVRGGRLECSMQSIADQMGDEFPSPSSSAAAAPEPDLASLSTFVLYSQRRKVTSSAKKRRKPGERRLAQTPEGSYLDYVRNWAEVLRMGRVAAPEVCGVDGYLARGGPNLLLRMHPALGPLWHVAAQKVRGGSVAEGSELELEIAEADVDNLRLDGSLRVVAASPLGPLEPTRPGGGERELLLRYDDARCGRVRLRNVTVRNAGVDWSAESNVYWSAQVARRESVLVSISGSGEFDAEGVTIEGDRVFSVPDGHRLTLRPRPQGVAAQGGGEAGYTEVLEPLGALPSWRWAYRGSAETGRITLTVENMSGPRRD